MGINLLTSYYLQSVLRVKKSLCISLLRNLILSGTAIIVFLLIFDGGQLVDSDACCQDGCGAVELDIFA